MTRNQTNLAITVLVGVLVAGFVIAARFYTGTVVPPVDAYVDGKRMLFIHTEASDPEVAGLLSRMKGSPVIVVPQLAKMPREFTAPVFVFKNGVPGEGPFKYQPDVFDNPPGAKGYTPLRELHLVTWKNERGARELKRAEDIRLAAERNEIVIERPGVVINMPFITWPDGRR